MYFRRVVQRCELEFLQLEQWEKGFGVSQHNYSDHSVMDNENKDTEYSVNTEVKHTPCPDTCSFKKASAQPLF